MSSVPLKKYLAYLSFILLLASCRPDPVQSAIGWQFRLYPETRVQDIYKDFCQDNLGPGHLIPNPEAAKAYLMEELQTCREERDSGVYVRPVVLSKEVGDAGNYVRVDLAVVLDSLVDAETLLDAFVRSANEGKTASEEEWKAKWVAVAGTLRKHFPDIPDLDEDLAAIDSLMSEGHYILHHSEAFEKAYRPHYRIVARDIYDSELKGKL